MKTLYIVGGVALAGGLAILLWPRKASATTMDAGYPLVGATGAGAGSGFGVGTGFGSPGGTAGGFGFPIAWSTPPAVVPTTPGPTQTTQEAAKRAAAASVLTDTMRGVQASLGPIAGPKVKRWGGGF